jgi:hypothetical protein
VKNDDPLLIPAEVPLWADGHQPKKGMWRNERAIRYVCLSVDRAKYREVILQSEAMNDRGSLKALSRQIERGT